MFVVGHLNLLVEGVNGSSEGPASSHLNIEKSVTAGVAMSELSCTPAKVPCDMFWKPGNKVVAYKTELRGLYSRQVSYPSIKNRLALRIIAMWQ